MGAPKEISQVPEYQEAQRESLDWIRNLFLQTHLDNLFESILRVINCHQISDFWAAVNYILDDSVMD